MPAGYSSPAISILVAAYNEERKMRPFLEQLRPALGADVEVIVGLDGCSDATAAIVRDFSFCRLLEFSERRGKSAVLADLLTAAGGEICIVADADWDVLVQNGWAAYLVSRFTDPRLGGIVIPTANLPVIDRGYLSRMSLAFTGEAWGSHFLFRHQVCTQVTREGSDTWVALEKMRFPFTVNIFRKSAVGAFLTTGDDFERCLQILAKGYRVVVDLSGTFLFRATDIDKTIADMFRQRRRGSTVYGNLEKIYGYRPRIGGFLTGSMLASLRELPAMGLKGIAGLFVWYATAAFARVCNVIAGAPGKTTGELWSLRQRR